MGSQIHRYILRQTLLTLLAITAVLTATIWLVYSLRYFDFLVNRNVSAGTFLYLVGLLLPRFLAIALPIALFCATLFVFYRLLADSELVVLRAAGLSDARLAAAPLLVAAGVALLVGALNIWAAPEAARAFRDLRFDIRNDLAALFIQPGVFRSIRPGVTLYVREQLDDGSFTGLLIHDERHQDRRVTYMAERGGLVATADGPRVVLAHGNRQELDLRTGKLTMLYFERNSVELGQLGEEVAERLRDASERSLAELFSAGAAEVGADGVGKFRAEAHRRLAATLHAPALAALALACLLVGEANRRGQARRVLAAALLGLLHEAATLGAKALTARMPAAAPLMYALPLVPLLAGFVLLWWRPTRSLPSGHFAASPGG